MKTKVSRIEIASLDEAKPATGESAEGLLFNGPGRTKALFDREGDSIRLRIHELERGSGLSWSPTEAGHLVYLWSGAVQICGRTAVAGETFVIEHGAAGEVSSLRSDTVLVEFTQNLRVGTKPAKPGGNVHAVPRADAFRCDDYADDGGSIQIVVHANARCPGCDLWLHESTLRSAGFEAALHYHNESEVILITGGDVSLGNRRYGRGTALAIAKNTTYGFRAGEKGVSFVNFRPGAPTVTLAKSDQSIDEWEDLVGKVSAEGIKIRAPETSSHLTGSTATSPAPRSQSTFNSAAGFATWARLSVTRSAPPRSI